ncbi:MAG: hypothetical protein P4L44_16540 [Oryzomonas sp.]|uniref:hypothetical protein n=1 Tax=Oryzomonas sp. TaxID=2855186 RepID=UPI00283DC862|nr:hypothetical protein [Oryzomonas sp.]MDR3581571.1 hypothetical protein [Oryzomonas sp.]
MKSILVSGAIFAVMVCMACPSAFALDASSYITNVERSGSWSVIELAFSKQIIYRIGSDSISEPSAHIVFDFAPLSNCKPTPADLILNFGFYDDVMNNGELPFEYKLPSQKHVIELVHSAMSPKDSFAFFTFKSLTVKNMLLSKDKGKLAVSVLPSGDGRVKKSNIYFDLDGFSLAYKKARELCRDNI